MLNLMETSRRGSIWLIFAFILGSLVIAAVLLTKASESNNEPLAQASPQVPRAEATQRSAKEDSAFQIHSTDGRDSFIGKPASVPIDRFDNRVIRTALASGDSKSVEAAIDALELCASLSNRRQLYASIDRNSDAGKQLPILEARTQRDEAFCANIDHDLVSRRAFYLREAIGRTFSPALARKLYLAGPNGNWEDAHLRPDDLLIQRWFDDAEALLIRAANAGDWQSMQTLTDIYRDGPSNRRDSVKALAYQIAQTEVQIKSQLIRSDSLTVNYLNQQLIKVSEVERKAAEAEAKAILQKCCSTR